MVTPSRIHRSQMRRLYALESSESWTRSLTPSTVSGSGAAKAPTLPSALAISNASVR